MGYIRECILIIVRWGITIVFLAVFYVGDPKVIWVCIKIIWWYSMSRVSEDGIIISRVSIT